MQILPNGKCQFIDQNGAPLVNGSVYFYAPSTTNPLPTYQDSAGTIANTNPIQLDSRGQAIIWGGATYRQVVKDASGVTVWDQIVSAAASAAALAGSGGAALIGTPDGSNLASALALGINHVVDSIAALRAVNHTFYARAFVTGYRTPSDGGGGAYSVDTSDTSSADNGGTIIVASDGARWKLQFQSSVDVMQFGADPAGATDSSAAFQAAVNAFSGKAGTVTAKAGNFLLSSTVAVPQNVHLQGPVRNVGEQRTAPTAVMYDKTGATLFVATAGGLTFGDAASIDGFWILNSALKGALPFPDGGTAQSAVNAFSGTAITQVGADMKVSNCWIGGFAQAIYVPTHERTKIDWVEIDCTAGVWIDNSSDIARLQNVHAWPFLTTHQTWSTGSNARRTGAGFKLTTHFDTGVCTNCFTFGYDIGFDVQALNTISLIGCFADGSGLSVGQIGFKITAAAELISIMGGGSSGVDTGVYCNTTAGNGAISLNGVQFWGNHAHIISDQHKVLSVDACYLRDTNGGSRTGVTLNSGVTGLTSVRSCTFDNLSTSWSVQAVPLARLVAKGNRFNGSLADGIGERDAAENSTNAKHFLDLYSDDSNPWQYVGRKGRGNAAAPTIVQGNDQLLSLYAQGYDGAGFQPAAQMRMQIQGAPASGVMPATLIFSTNNGSGISDRLAVHNTGYLYPITDNAYSLGQSANRFSTVYAATGTINTSDGNTKTDIENATLGLDFISALRPVSYKFKVGGTEVVRQVFRDASGNECDPSADGATPAEIITQERPGSRTHWGLIAQEVKAVADAAGIDFAGWTIEDKSDPNSLQGLRYDQFISPIIKAVQELSAKVAAQSDIIDGLVDRLASLESRA
jgi:hypothetical protein